MKSPPVLDKSAAASTYRSGENFWLDDNSVVVIVGGFDCWWLWRIGIDLGLGSSLFSPKVLAEHSIPRWNHDRHSTVCLRLTGQANERFWLIRVDISKLLNLLALSSGNIR